MGEVIQFKRKGESQPVRHVVNFRGKTYSIPDNAIPEIRQSAVISMERNLEDGLKGIMYITQCNKIYKQQIMAYLEYVEKYAEGVLSKSRMAV